MPKRLLCIALTLLLLAGTLTACSKSDGSGMDLAYPIAIDPQSLDPQISASSAAATVLINCLEGLVRLDENGGIVNAAAQSHTLSPDGLIYTFTLRADAVWHMPRNFARDFGDEFADTFDTAVTAHDFVFALRRALMPETRSPDAALLYAIKNARAVHQDGAAVDTLGVKAEDNRTLILTLESADGDFLRLLTTPIALPCNEAFFNATNGRYGLETRYLLSNGPFYLNRWNTDRSLFLLKNNDYHSRDLVLPASVTLRVAPEEDRYAERLLQGSYSAAPLTHDDAMTISDSAGVTLIEYPNTTWAFCFNCADANLPTQIRRALSAGLHREALDTHSGSARVAAGLIPPGCVYGNASYRQAVPDPVGIAYNETLAKQWWDEGLQTLEDDSVTLTLLCVEKHEEALRVLLQHWQRVFGIGLKLSISIVPLEELLSRVERSDFTLAFAPIKATSSSVSEYLHTFTTDGAANFLNYRSDTYDNLLNNPGSLSALDAYHEAETHLIKDAAVYPVYYESGYFALSEGVTGIYTGAEGGGVYFLNGRSLK